MFVQVEDTKYVRDTKSMALINQDHSARDEYYSKVKILNAQKSEINNIKSEVSTIRSDMEEIKLLLSQLLSKGGNG